MSRHVQDHGAIAALSVAVPAYTETVSCVLLQSYMTCTSLCRLTQPLTGAAQEAGVLALVASAGDEDGIRKTQARRRLRWRRRCRKLNIAQQVAVSGRKCKGPRAEARRGFAHSSRSITTTHQCKHFAKRAWHDLHFDTCMHAAIRAQIILQTHAAIATLADRQPVDARHA